MFRRPLIGLCCLLLSGAPVVFADAYETLQKDALSASGALLRETTDHQDDLAASKYEARDEFFPDTGEPLDARDRPVDPGAAEGVVSFRIAGVPYVLRDVPLLAWFAPYVRDVAEKGIVSGYRTADGVPTGVFGPERSVSVEELAKMAIEAGRIDKTPCVAPAKNPLAATSWSTVYIACAEQHSFALYGDGSVNIKRPATRAEVVMTILEAFGVQTRETATAPFTDVTSSTLFSAAIHTAVLDGIVSGYVDKQGNPTRTFGPENPVNRAEIAKILSVALQKYGRR